MPEAYRLQNDHEMQKFRVNYFIRLEFLSGLCSFVHSSPAVLLSILSLPSNLGARNLDPAPEWSAGSHEAHLKVQIWWIAGWFCCFWCLQSCFLVESGAKHSSPAVSISSLRLPSNLGGQTLDRGPKWSAGSHQAHLEVQFWWISGWFCCLGWMESCVLAENLKNA